MVDTKRVGVAECIFLLFLCLGLSPTTPSTTSCDTREEGDSLSTGAVVAITTIATLLVSLPVGVLVGSCGTLLARRGRERKDKGGVIYEDPVVRSVANTVAIPLSENQAYGQIPSNRR